MSFNIKKALDNEKDILAFKRAFSPLLTRSIRQSIYSVISVATDEECKNLLIYLSNPIDEKLNLSDFLLGKFDDAHEEINLQIFEFVSPFKKLRGIK